jgi:hypothetical protein
MAELATWEPNNPGRNLDSILTFVIDLLDEEINSLDKELYNKTMVAAFGELLKAAWRDARPRAQNATRQVYEISQTNREEHGLFGPQLELKFKLLEFHATRFSASPTRYFLKKLLEWINAILPSLFGALNAQTFLDELKKCIEQLLSDD